jgi:hypothetical protein
LVGGICLRKEDKEGPVDPGEVYGTIIEGIEHRKNIIRKKLPEGRVESRAETIGAQAGKLVHVAKGLPNFIAGKGGAKSGLERGGAGIKV